MITEPLSEICGEGQQKVEAFCGGEANFLLFLPQVFVLLVVTGRGC